MRHPEPYSRAQCPQSGFIAGPSLFSSALAQNSLPAFTASATPSTKIHFPTASSRKKMKRVLLIALTFAACVAVVPMFASSGKTTPVYPGSVFVGYGEAKDGAKKISVAGDVAKVGEYFLPTDATLYDLVMRLGPCSGHSEFSPPHSVVLTIRGPDGTPVRETHRIFQTPPEELKRVPLVAGVICYFPLRVL